MCHVNYRGLHDWLWCNTKCHMTPPVVACTQWLRTSIVGQRWIAWVTLNQMVNVGGIDQLQTYRACSHILLWSWPFILISFEGVVSKFCPWGGTIANPRRHASTSRHIHLAIFGNLPILSVCPLVGIPHKPSRTRGDHVLAVSGLGAPIGCP